jgi:glutamate carboxypeptidase
MPTPDAATLHALRGRLGAGLPAFIAELRELVAIDSGTGDAEGVGRVGARLADRLEALGFTLNPTLGADARSGGAVVASRAGRATGPTLLLVGHHDTVFDAGTAAQRPFRLDGQTATGPGVIDMKGGLVLLLHALDALADETGPGLDTGRLIVISSPDEELGSPTGSRAIRELAATANAALVLEPARPNGALVHARKGMLQARLTATGRAAHAGVNPGDGRNAVIALARAAIEIDALARPDVGLTATVGALHGGTRPNIVPDEATLLLDIRAPKPDLLDEAEAAVRAIVGAPSIDGVTIEMEVTGRFAPMPLTPASAQLLQTATAIGQALGMALTAEATGGASDANTIAGLGVPVLDGLGPVGGAAHTAGEWLDLASAPDRGALLAGLILALTKPNTPG